jgi:LPS sulfotransferase NodH
MLGLGATVPPVCSYLVCATPRSGSTLLCHLLSRTGVAGRPEEYFEALLHSGRPRRPHEYFDPEGPDDILQRLAFREMPDREASPSPLWDNADYGPYLESVLKEGTTPNGVFGAKLMWGYLDDFTELLATIPGYAELTIPQRLARAFPDLRYVWITRADKVRQAVSLWKAVQTQAWRAERDAAANRATSPPEYSFRAIDHLMGQLREHDAAWTGYFKGLGVTPLTITYEELAEAHEPVIRRVLAHVGADVPDALEVGPPELKIQADALSEEWVQRYKEMARQPRTPRPLPPIR